MLKWFDRLRAANEAEAASPSGPLTSIAFPKFYDQAPSAQAAVDIFKDRWASRLPDVDGRAVTAGAAGLFTDDPRPQYAAAAFGGGTGRLDGFSVLELGPLEGGHSWRLESLGAEVIGVEGNAEAYLKCLIAKEILGMRARFWLGDFVKYLDETDSAFDLIFASGVLYHMTQPLQLIELICRRSARSLVWTHHYDAGRCADYVAETAEHVGFAATHYRKSYGASRGTGKFWGGLADSACWLARDDIVAAFQAYGHSKVEVVESAPDHPYGPAFTIVTSR